MLFLEHKSLEISKAKPSFMLARVEAAMARDHYLLPHITSGPGRGRTEIFFFYCGGIIVVTGY